MLIRSAILVAFLVFVLCGLFGVFGVRSGHKTATAGDLTVELTYPQVARPALAIPFVVHITGLDPSGVDVVVRIRSSYLAMFDENGTSPTPLEETDDGEWTTWVYESPPGGALDVSLDTRVEPGMHWGRNGTVRVAFDDDEARIEFRTWVAP
jgi:hypothetical protein